MPIEYDEDLVRELKEALRTMANPVKVYFFRDPESECEHCDDIRDILGLLAKASEKISVLERFKGSVEARQLEIPLFPAIVIHGVEEYNIRFFGTPAGYEFGALVEDIVDASKGSPKNLSSKLADVLRKFINKKTRIKVFVTPTCPYCPLAVRAAHRFAMVNRFIYGDMIEALEFPDLADSYGVYAVPKVIIEVEGEDRVEFEGALPDVHFVAEILRANDVDPAEAGLRVTRHPTA